MSDLPGPAPENNADAGTHIPPVDLIAEECRKLLKRTVQEQLSQMSPDDREILIATHLDPNYRPTLARLASEKGSQPAAIRKRASRARQRLRDLLSLSSRWPDLLRCFGIKRVVL